MDYSFSWKSRKAAKGIFQLWQPGRVLLSSFLGCCVFILLAFGGLTLFAQDASHVGDDPGLVRLEKEIARLAKGAQGVVGVGAIHLETGREVYLNKSVGFPMASTFKVPIAVKLLSLVDQGKLKLDDMIPVEAGDRRLGSGTLTNLFDDPGVELSVLNLMKLMLIISDNSATDLCIRTAGGTAAVTQYMRDIGIEGIRVDRTVLGIINEYLGIKEIPNDARITIEELMELLKKIPPEEQKKAGEAFNADPKDTTTPEGMALLLKKIWNREILTEESSALMLDIMKRCETGLGRIRGILPEGTVVYHKTGTIGGTLNDAGIISLPDNAGNIIAAIYIKESKVENEKREQVIAQISRALYDYFLFNPEVK
ncbi:MAG: class A beta-lactamase [Candidatus Aminicenantes bacterium]|nr:MAG: class A beta-lactamase [Candidatus Aminicenantes bacterium]